MFTLLEVAQLAKNIAVLSAVPVEARPQNQVLAVKTLGDLKSHGSILALTDYYAATNKLSQQAGVFLPEPWVAFQAGGPGHPPPAVNLLRPPPDGPGAWGQIYDIFLNWTGPGQMYKILSGQGLPTNGLMEAMEAAVGKAAVIASSLLQTLVIVAGLGLGIYFVTRDSGGGKGS